MKTVFLNQGWILQNERVGTMPATVPGCVHTDLIAGGVIQDIFWRDNNRNYQWIENCDWTYSCAFDAEPADDVQLVFEGLDTYARITLNGSLLDETDNMFIPHRFAVGQLLRKKDNLLEVHFHSPIAAVADKPELIGSFTRERLHTRRIQCTYSWDWVDRFVTCGIYRPVSLVYANGIDVENVYIHTDHLDSFGAQICAEISFDHLESGGAMAHVEILDPDGKTAAKTDFYADQPLTIRYFDIPDPALWYPAGYGAQPLYKLVITVGENRFEETFGIRTLRIVQLADKPGDPYWKLAVESKETLLGQRFEHNEDYSGFFVLVNGVRIYCRGCNWVPCEPFPSAETPEKIQMLVARAAEMGANFLRVWGGGIFEQKAFYDACDRCGILVAQDFLMACGSYPEKEAWFLDALKAEAAHAAKLLRNHPCLAWWHGDNENAVRGSDLQEDYKGRDSALKAIGPMLRQFDRTRQFLPSSPYGGDTYASPAKGTCHNTNACKQIFDYGATEACEDYKEFFSQFTARFISEEPVFGAVSRSSMLKFMTEADLLSDPKEEMIYYHTKTNPGLNRHIFSDISAMTEKVLGGFADGEDKFFKYKYMQYEWIRVVFENYRRHLGYNDGVIFWMYDDCWPAAAGWSMVDYYGLPKHAYYSFKRCAKDVIAAANRRNGKYIVTLSNTGHKAAEVTLTAATLNLKDSKKITQTHSCKVTVPAYGVAEAELPMAVCESALLVCDARYEGGSDRCFYKFGNLPLVRADGALRIVARSDDSITLEADAYIHAVELEGQYVFSDNCFSLLAGEQKEIRFNPYDNPIQEDFTVTAYTIAEME